MVRVFRELVGCLRWKAVRVSSLTPAEIVVAAGEVGSLAVGKWGDVALIGSEGDLSGRAEDCVVS
jgi:N-acetylglucosamine-6-phosphate deacetylase